MARVGLAATRALVMFSAAALMLSLLPGMAVAEEDSANAQDALVGAQVDSSDEMGDLSGFFADLVSGSEAAGGTVLSVQEEGSDANATTDDSSSAASSTANSSSASNTSTHAPTVSVEHALGWANTAAEAKEWFGDEQAVLANGTADVISVTLPASDGGATLTAAELAKKTEQDNAYYLKGILCAPTGSMVTMKLTPARGYQLAANTINGGKIAVAPVDDDEKVGQYTFPMPAEGLALDCGFKATNDTVITEDSEAVKSGTITDADSVITSGTLLLEVEDIDDSSVKKAFNEKAGSNKVVAYIDTTLSNVVYQGSAENVWDTVLDETSSPITVTLALPDSVVSGSSSFYIIRAVNDQYQQASATYNASAKSISFKSNKFESYAIVRGAPSSSTSGSGSNNQSSQGGGTTTPQTGDADKTAPFIVSAIASAGLAAYALRRMRCA